MKHSDDGRSLFRKFHGRDPRPGELVLISPPEREVPALAIGTLWGLIYKTKAEAKPYIHKFSRLHRPLLFVSSDGSQAYILKGGYRFTDRGFIG